MKKLAHISDEELEVCFRVRCVIEELNDEAVNSDLDHLDNASDLVNDKDYFTDHVNPQRALFNVLLSQKETVGAWLKDIALDTVSEAVNNNKNGHERDLIALAGRLKDPDHRTFFENAIKEGLLYENTDHVLNRFKGEVQSVSISAPDRKDYPEPQWQWIEYDYWVDEFVPFHDEEARYFGIVSLETPEEMTGATWRITAIKPWTAERAFIDEDGHLIDPAMVLAYCAVRLPDADERVMSRFISPTRWIVLQDKAHILWEGERVGGDLLRQPFVIRDQAVVFVDTNESPDEIIYRATDIIRTTPRRVHIKVVTDAEWRRSQEQLKREKAHAKTTKDERVAAKALRRHLDREITRLGLAFDPSPVHALIAPHQKALEDGGLADDMSAYVNNVVTLNFRRHLLAETHQENELPTLAAASQALFVEKCRRKLEHLVDEALWRAERRRVRAALEQRCGESLVTVREIEREFGISRYTDELEEVKSKARRARDELTGFYLYYRCDVEAILGQHTAESETD